MKKVVIIGNGIAGITAARHIRKHSDYAITVISAETEFFWSRTALMYIYMGHMKFEHTKPYEDHFWKENNIDLFFGRVNNISSGQNMVICTDGTKFTFDYLILATGSKPNKFGWEGQDLNGVSGMVSYQDLEMIEAHTHQIERGVIVGGGLIGIELAEMLRSRNIDVTFLVREKDFWTNVLPSEDAAMISAHIREHHVDLRLETELDKILPDDNGNVRAVQTIDGEIIPCQFVGLTAGVHPNIDLAADSGIETDRGFLADEYLRTSVPNIFAVGDCAQLRNPPPGRQPIEPLWYTGRMMGEVAAKNITGTPVAYTPGPWFNSAKFFDIEYQTYGQVPHDCPDNQHDFYWQHQSGRKAVHIRFGKEDLTLKGVNSFGIRMRHELFDTWLRKGIQIQEFMDKLEDVNFDPEFFEDHSGEIRELFSQKFPQIRIKAGRKRNKILGLF
ncbi:NAD(P)/FAD-dependent oxidoreductase [Fulvivirga sedimenti]|uniref:NAD(P)/FAD-dependent oxidoreductase n=1 Tax=Fulvivirga sedimenti TaxID=2879465 RepID=A0A9X1KV04_9BACT|nr:FAD/NAD(P)-binding oxidoreductase [Fulvivirga sedimenti]MCA6074133.1 NAD(P)/FAD-dependent oxidoreductase [Fulvivirga sedimenti]